MASRVSFVAAAVLATAVSALDIVVPSGKTSSECFIERIDANNKLTGSFEVISGGFLDIDMDVSEADSRPKRGHNANRCIAGQRSKRGPVVHRHTRNARAL